MVMVPMTSCPVLVGTVLLHALIPAPVPICRISKLTNYSHSDRIAFCKVVLSLSIFVYVY